ncbi:hypothetical protein AB6A40_010851 [Gnathostoma spinigerum]|uniref:Uncharacterized protein n=1 Tax=Gnathostoma spinigerum TaxID=75299 RepID=A0ABD6F3I5_9BILA
MFASDLIKRRCAQSDSDSSIVHNSNSTTEDEIDVVTILPSPPRKLQKCELTSQNEEPIVVIDDSDQRSNSFNAELIGISPCSARKDTQMQGHQEEAVVLNYINLGVVFIADAIKTSRFAIGSKQRLISAIMVSVSEPLRIIDNLWTMSIVISDDSYSGLECLVSHSALYELIGFRPEEAMVNF